MKKSIIALAVAGALTAPLAQADATLYGVAQFRLIDQDGSSLNANMAKTRLGVKGTVDNDIEGLTTGFQFEWEFNGDTNGSAAISDPGTTDAAVNQVNIRKSNVYLKGDFGQVTFGTQNNIAAQFKKADIMGRHSAQYALVGDRVAKAVAYASPDLGGLQLSAGFTADGAADASSEDLDTYALAATYGIAGVDLALTHEAANNKTANTDTDTTSFGASYSMGDLYVAGSYSEMSSDVAGTPDQDVIQVAASYAFGKTTVYGQYEVRDTGVSGRDELEKTGLGVSYALGSSASVAIETFAFNGAAEAGTTGTNAVSAASDATLLQYTLSF